jgi:TPR repeat protein
MKTEKWPLLALAFAIIIVSGVACQAHGGQSTNTPAAVQETWDQISNRWSSASILEIQKDAEAGDVTAQYFLAIAYSDGEGVTNDQARAFQWMHSAAQQGMPRAQRKLGWMLQNGLGTETNYEEAAEWYQKAAGLGDEYAQINLGWMYENGVGVDQDYGKAAACYREAADQGNSTAQNTLGWFYLKGLGLPKDPNEALKWFEKSATRGEPLAEENLAWLYAQGAYGTNLNVYGQGAEAQIKTGGIAPDHTLAEQWMQKALDLNTADGEYQFANLLNNEMDDHGEGDITRYPAAGEWFKKAAGKGDVRAEYELAEMYNNGHLGDDQRSNCIPWYLKAAAQGSVEAKAEIGELPVLYPNSDLLKSINNMDFLQQSAASGNVDAQFRLAKSCQTGHGVPKDPVLAFQWMQKAAENDSASSRVLDARYCLGVMYEKGEGTNQNLPQAYQLYLSAVLANDKGPQNPQFDATFRVGKMYEQGQGVSRDDHIAANYYENILYFNDHPDIYPGGYVNYVGPSYQSIESLLNLWSRGRGLPTSDEKKIHGYPDPALVLNNADAQINTANAEFYLGKIYYEGKIVPQNLVEAAARFQLAANHASEDAGHLLTQIRPQLSPAQNEQLNQKVASLEQRFKQAQSSYENQERLKDIVWWQ